MAVYHLNTKFWILFSLLTSCVKCTDCYENHPNQYKGTRNTTAEGFKCQRWIDKSPQHHPTFENYKFPERSASKAVNYCRDPNDTGSPYCYTLEPNIRWQYCGIDICQSDCSTGKFGENCLHSCNHTCKNGVCSKRNGNCIEGCEPGYTGHFCNDKCKIGKYGQNCNNTCSEYCKKTSVCRNTDGLCDGGCKAGYHRDTCKHECEDGRYGENCLHDCSLFCKDNLTCRKIDGICEMGCSPGYIGDKCDKKCVKGYYGQNCSFNCSENCLNFCVHTNGLCENGCEPGWSGDTCSIECEIGTYGYNCSSTCSSHCINDSVCERTNGQCIAGCNPGWIGDTCDADCPGGTYGLSCSLNCSKHCLNDLICNNTNGFCPSGCAPGWMGNTCNEKCPNGTYGEDCSSDCSDNCFKDSVCLHTNGSCMGGCVQGFKGELCEEALQLSSEPSSPVGAITGGIVGAVVAALIIAGVIIVWKRRQQRENPHSKYSGDEFIQVSKSENRKVKRNVADPSKIYVNVSEVREEIQAKGIKDARDFEEDEDETDYYNTQSEHEILLSKLETYVNTGLANEDFINQFKLIPYGMQYPCSTATRPANHGKNRYKEMYAYDHSRVVLKAFPGQPDTDYINATFVKGYSGDNCYIAAQGPIVNTLDDFWRMIWERNIKTIVMATNLSEQGKMKCVQYWPEVGQSMQNGNIIGILETEDVFAEFTVRRLKVSQQDKPEKTRIVTQFHYTAWPDKDVPRSTSSLLHFWYQVRKHDGQKARPWLVHCSAGVGRTGTFIALDILYDQGKQNGSVDVYTCVELLRRQRVNMVQTKHQYSYLHSIMVEALVLPSQPVTSEEFHRVYNDLKQIENNSGKTKLLMQYETLQAKSDDSKDLSDNDIYSAAKKSENRGKNRYDNILAPDEFRPFLLTQVPGCTNYINSVFIPSYRDKFAYILTQTPSKSTAIDCCRLVFEQEVKLIVTFNENEYEDIGVYLPGKGSVKIGPFTMSLVAEENKTHGTKRDYELLFESKKRCVSQLIFKHWTPSKLTPTDPTKVWYFLQELDDLQRQNESKPIMIQCLNGAERSGLFVVLMNVLERLRFDDEVSIPLVMRQLKIRRQQIIPNLEQFKFCHEVVLSHIENNTTYSNM